MTKKTIFFTLFISIFLNSTFLAQGDILITPKRIVFSESDIKRKITLINVGDTESLFTVSFVQRRMNEDGSVTSITNPDPGEKFATPHLRIYPRRVVLKPGESQIVILQRRRSNNIEDGEYRSHLSFLSLPNITPLKNLTPVIEKDSITFSTNLTTSFSISIPIILRYGKPNVSSYISDLKLEGTQLRFNINRKGNVSTYGDFLIEYIPEEGEPFSILNRTGVGVYTTIEKRKMTFNLDKTTNIDFNKGSLKVIFKAPSGSIQEVFAEKTLLLRQ
jgi:hypothetical protein